MRNSEIERCVAQWLDSLPDQQGWVIRRSLALEGAPRASLDGLAKDLQLSAEQVRQIELQALEELARGLRNLRLESSARDHGRHASVPGNMGERGAGLLPLARTADPSSPGKIRHG